MTALWADLRCAARLLVKAPTFAVVAIATLALGIGASTAIFSVVNAVLLNPLPFADPERLVVVSEAVQRDSVERRAFSLPDFRDLNDRNQSFEAMSVWSNGTLTLSIPDTPVREVPSASARRSCRSSGWPRCCSPASVFTG